MHLSMFFPLGEGGVHRDFDDQSCPLSGDFDVHHLLAGGDFVNQPS